METTVLVMKDLLALRAGWMKAFTDDKQRREVTDFAKFILCFDVICNRVMF